MTLRLSYAQTKEVRKFEFQFEDSTLFVDSVGNRYALYGKEGELVEEKTDSTIRNELFEAEVLHPFECVNVRKESNVNIVEARKSLQVAFAIKRQIAKKV